MKILVVSDYESPIFWDFFKKERFNGIDLIISCGDLKASYLSFLTTLVAVPVLYVHGNHDRTYDKEPPEGCICIEDKVFEYGGIYIGGLGGSMEYVGGVHQYTEKAMEKRVRKLMRACRKTSLDVFVTHAPTLNLGDGLDLCHKGFNCFYQIYDQLNPTFHVHGHQHLNYGCRLKREHNYKNVQIINCYDHYIIEL